MTPFWTGFVLGGIVVALILAFAISFHACSRRDAEFRTRSGKVHYLPEPTFDPPKPPPPLPRKLPRGA